MYFPAIAADCRRWDLPAGTATRGALVGAVHHGALPAFSIVVPDACDDTHNCPAQTGDTWLSRWLPVLLTGPQYRSGHTVVFVTWDEGRAHTLAPCHGSADPTCHVATLVISPGTPAGTRSPRFFTHYSLLRTTERLLGLPLLGAAGRRGTANMAADFGLR